MINIKKWWKKLNFKTKIGLFFCSLPFILWIIAIILSWFFPNFVVFNLFFLGFPLMSLGVLFVFLSSFVFHCDWKGPVDSIICIISLILSVIIWFLILFGLGWTTGFIIEKIKTKKSK